MIKFISQAILTAIVFFIAIQFIDQVTSPQKEVKECVYRGEINENPYDTLNLKRATMYHPSTSQCDANPIQTADMSIIDIKALKRRLIRWVALSRDLIARWGGPFDYGDTITINSNTNPELNGQWVVRDCMNARYTKAIDFLIHPDHEITINHPSKNDIKILIPSWTN